VGSLITRVWDARSFWEKRMINTELNAQTGPGGRSTTLATHVASLCVAGSI